MIRLLAATILALGFAFPALAGKPAEYERHALTVPLVEKFIAATRELDKLPKKKDDDKSMEDASLDELVKEFDAAPGVKPILARHGLNSRTYALTVLAYFHAGFFVAMEPSMDKKKAAQLLATYTPEMQANVDLLRKNPKLLKKD